jgi:hypothetical protein
MPVLVCGNSTGHACFLLAYTTPSRWGTSYCVVLFRLIPPRSRAGQPHRVLKCIGLAVCRRALNHSFLYRLTIGSFGSRNASTPTPSAQHMLEYSSNVSLLLPFNARFSLGIAIPVLLLMCVCVIPFSSRYPLIFLATFKPSPPFNFRFARSLMSIIIRLCRNVKYNFRFCRNIFCVRQTSLLKYRNCRVYYN